jgi:hypothetical protein
LDTFRHHVLLLFCARVLQAARKRKFSVEACIGCKHEGTPNSSWSTFASNFFLQQHLEEEQVLAVPHEEEEQVLAAPHGGSLESSAPKSSSACNVVVN